MSPKDIDSWVGGLAHALAELHQTALDGAGGALTRPPRAETWRAPPGEHAPLTASAVGAFTAHRPSRASEPVLTHGDFHPGNVLWHRGHISGLVDWSAAQLDARWYDLAYCRAEVCLLLGPDVADRLADEYSDIVGAVSDELAVYDLMCLLNTQHYAPESLAAYQEQGHAPDYQLSLAHLDEQLRRALKRLGWAVNG